METLNTGTNNDVDALRRPSSGGLGGVPRFLGPRTTKHELWSIMQNIVAVEDGRWDEIAAPRSERPRRLLVSNGRSRSGTGRAYYIAGTDRARAPRKKLESEREAIQWADEWLAKHSASTAA